MATMHEDKGPQTITLKISAERARKLSSVLPGHRFLLHFGYIDYGMWVIDEVWREEATGDWFVRYKQAPRESFDF